MGWGVLHCQNKESVYTNWLPHKTLERSKPFSNSGNFLRGLLWTLKIFSASARYRVSLLQQQVSQTKFWTVRNLETVLPRWDRMRVHPLLLFLCLLSDGRAQKFSAITVGLPTTLYAFSHASAQKLKSANGTKSANGFKGRCVLFI